MKIKKSTATFLLLFATNLLVAVVAFYILPKRFFYDSVIITFDRGKEIGFMGSYPLTILFYKITGLRYLSYPLIAVIQYPVLVYILYKIGIPTNFEKINSKNLLVYLGFFMMAIFMSMPSKEFITFIYLSIIVFIYQNQVISFKKSILLSVLLLFIFGAFYRPYFALIPLLAAGMYGVSFVNFKNNSTSQLFATRSYRINTASHVETTLDVDIQPIAVVDPSQSGTIEISGKVIKGYSSLWLYFAIIVDNLASGLAGAAFIAFLSSLTSVSFTAVQYAIFSSLMTLTPKLLGGYSGTIVSNIGYPNFFLMTTLVGIPILILVVWVAKLLHDHENQTIQQTGE